MLYHNVTCYKGYTMEICTNSNNNELLRKVMVLCLVLNIKSYVSKSIRDFSYSMRTRISVCKEGAKSSVISPCSR